MEIRALEYKTAVGFWSASANTRAALKAICRWDSSSYEKLYRAEYKRGAFVVPTGGKTDRLVNQALSDVLNQLLEDRVLVGCLAGRPAPP